MRFTFIITIILFSVSISMLEFKEDTCDPGIGPNRCNTCAGDECASCNSGDYLEEGKCLTCIEKDPKCEQCFKDSNKITCTKCIAGYFLNEGICKNCLKTIENCAYCKEDEKRKPKCNFCLNGYGLINGKCYPCNDKSCEKCDEDLDTCKVCFDYTYLDFYSRKCKSCTDHCNFCDLNGACLVCEGSYYLLEKENKCVRCPDNCKNCLDENHCSTCISGYGLNMDLTKCNKCSLSNCKVCYFDSNMKEFCSKCNKGFGLTEDNSGCKECKYIPNCELCEYDSFGIPRCYQCSDGYYLEDSLNCVQCKKEHCLCSSINPDGCSGCLNGFFSYAEEDNCQFSCQVKFEHCLACDKYNCFKCETGYTSYNGKCVETNNIVEHCKRLNVFVGCDVCEEGYSLKNRFECVLSPVGSIGSIKYSVTLLFIFLLLI